MAERAENKKRAQQEKEKGNKAFKKGNQALAIKHFTQAIALAPSDKTLYSNRSAAYAASAKHDKRKFEDAVNDALKVIELDADWGKGYARHANVLFLQGKYAEAVKVYAVGISKDPSNKSLVQGLQAAQKKISKAGGDKSESKNDSQSSSSSSVNNSTGNEEYAIGIDLGTTNSCVAVWKGQGVEIIQNNLGDRTTPSFVSWTESGDRLVGQPAKNLTTSNPRNTVYDIKRIIGQRYTDQGVEQDARKFAYTIERGADDRPVAVVEVGEGNEKRFAPEEVSAMVLQNLKQTAEAYLGRKVTRAVVTVPAYFNDAQRNATKAAGRIAGLDVLRIINEPTAAALAYGLDSSSDKPTNVLIFDLGGGTFDVSLLHISGGLFEVKATGGDTRLGGEDFDHSISEFLIKEAERKGFSDLHSNRRAVRRLNLAAERAKRVLSSSQSAEIDVESLAEGRDFALTLTRARFEQLNRATFLRCLETVQRVLKDAKLKPAAVDEIVLVGGSTRIPKLQQMLQEHFGGKELCKSVNPDEAVAYGAAVQAAILTGLKSDATKDLLLMDVTPLSLGIETVGRVMSVIIPRNTHIPCVRKQIYTTEEDYQTAIDVCVFEGERSKTEFNNVLGKFTITGIQRAKKHEPQIEVRFELDADGILKVTATDLVTDAKADIVVENRQSTNSDEVERMIKDAERFKARDDELIRRAEASNSLQATIYKVHEAAQEKAAGLSQKLRATLRQAAAQAQDWLDDNAESAAAEEIERRCRNLERRIHARASVE